MRWPLVSLSALISLLVGGCTDVEPRPAHASHSQAIVNGDRERGHPAVGALVRGDNRAFCTGTLIRPGWVLAASHCFNDAVAENTFFYVGDRAGRDGVRYPTAALHRHPRWSAGVLIGIYDIALVELAEPVEDVEPYGLFDGDMEALRGQPLLYVGFGANEADPPSGTGIKRSTSLPVFGLTPTMYISAHDGSGVCFGDSGGPGLVEIDGGWRVVGVNSAVRGQPACLFQSLQVRVDAFLPWIRATLGEGASCAAAPAEDCGCAAACVDGICDPLGCPPDTGCRRLVNCLSGCQGNAVCQTNCYGDGSPAARALYDETVACGSERCGDAEDVDACMRERCPTLDECWRDINLGEDDCETMIRCNTACGRDDDCRFECYAAGSAEGREGYDALVGCIQRECAALANDPVAYQRCVLSDCTAAWHVCAPPDDCALTGGDCAAGEACRIEPWTGRYCRPTADLPAGSDCAGDAIECADGSLCDARADGRICRAICLAGDDCAPGQRCTPLANQAEPVGVCTGCVDTDLDGTCDAADCAPEDESRHANAREICEDGIDQDCDDAVDEGCAADMGPAIDAGPADAAVEPDAGPVPDAGVDAALPPADMRAPDAATGDMRPAGDPDAAVDAGQVIERGGRSDGCRAAPGGSSGGLAGWVLGLIGLARRRRRADKLVG